jgi:hypothetical protein
MALQAYLVYSRTLVSFCGVRARFTGDPDTCEAKDLGDEKK